MKIKRVGWLVVLRINVDLAILKPYLDLEAGDNQSLKIQVARPGIEPGPLAPQAKSLTTRPPLLQDKKGESVEVGDVNFHKMSSCDEKFATKRGWGTNF